MPTRNRQHWKLDNQGVYARQIGWKHSRNGKLIQHKFRLGADLKEAKRREQKLLELWSQVEEDSVSQPIVWTFFALDLGKQIAKGKFQIELPRKPHDGPEAYARYLHRLQRHYPMVSIVAEDEEAYVSGAAANRTMVQEQIGGLQEQIAIKETKHARMGNIGEIDLSRQGGMLHDAMRAYIEWIKKDCFRPALGRVTDGGRTRMRQIETLMTRHENQPLSMLDETAVEEMFRFWRQRPFKKDSTKPISKKSAENYIGELKRFLRWLHKCKDFDWRKPEDFDEIKTNVDAAPGDQQRKLVQVDTFSLDELRLLNEYATPLERVFLLLGINCGFGVAEIASLLVGEVVLFKGHEQRHQEIMGYPTTNADSFIKRIRRKNSVYGEHILFPQTVEAMQWVLERRRKHPNFDAEAVLLLNDRGETYNRPTKGNHRNQQIPSRFADLLRRIRRDHPDFPTLSFGKLRKTAGDLIRRFADGEIHAVFMCHGQPVATDNLTDVYSNRPFGKVFKAIREAQEYLQPIFAAAGATPFNSRLSQVVYRSPTRDKILQLHDQGLSVRAIAEKVGRSRTTVHRHITRHRPPSI
jgi:DNA-directed RNA polymerase specialized sigma24 family protein